MRTEARALKEERDTRADEKRKGKGVGVARMREYAIERRKRGGQGGTCVRAPCGGAMECGVVVAGWHGYGGPIGGQDADRADLVLLGGGGERQAG